MLGIANCHHVDGDYEFSMSEYNRAQHKVPLGYGVAEKKYMAAAEVYDTLLRANDRPVGLASRQRSITLARHAVAAHRATGVPPKALHPAFKSGVRASGMINFRRA